ncbi:MAG: hypothetical protein U0271_40700 [Polyangiaceae bacterium]
MTLDKLVSLFVRALGAPAFYGLLLQAALGYLLPYWAQRELLARMDAERRARSWNALSWACAILWGGWLSMIPFSWVTRPTEGLLRGPRNLLFGFAAAALGLALDELAIGSLLEWIFKL